MSDLTDVVRADIAYPPLTDAGVRLVRDNATGAAAIVLSADAVDALATYLDGLGAAHDLIDGYGYDPAGVDVILAIRGILR